MLKSLLLTAALLTALTASSKSFASTSYEGAIIKDEAGLTIEINGNEIQSMNEVFELFNTALELPTKTIQSLNTLENSLKDKVLTVGHAKFLFISGEALRTTLNRENKNQNVDKLNDLIDVLNNLADSSVDAEGYPAFDVTFFQ